MHKQYACKTEKADRFYKRIGLLFGLNLGGSCCHGFEFSPFTPLLPSNCQFSKRAYPKVSGLATWGENCK
jgi:hypothetical protein